MITTSSLKLHISEERPAIPVGVQPQRVTNIVQNLLQLGLVRYNNYLKIFSQGDDFSFF